MSLQGFPLGVPSRVSFVGCLLFFCFFFGGGGGGGGGGMRLRVPFWELLQGSIIIGSPLRVPRRVPSKVPPETLHR